MCTEYSKNIRSTFQELSLAQTSILVNMMAVRTYTQKLNGEMQLCKEVFTAWRWLLKEGRSKLDDEIEQDYKVEHNAEHVCFYCHDNVCVCTLEMTFDMFYRQLV